MASRQQMNADDLSKIIDIKGRLPVAPKRVSGKACMYDLGPYAIYAPSSDSVVSQNDEYTFDTCKCMVIFKVMGEKGMQNMIAKVEDFYSWKPTFLRVKRAQVTISDATDEALILQLDSLRAGLVIAPAEAFDEKKAPE